MHDHYECFQEIASSYVDHVVLWPAWLKQHGPWTAADLTTKGYKPPKNSQIPSPADVAGALNLLAKPPPPGGADYYKLLSQTSVGSIAGVTTVLDDFWNAKTQAASPVPFPFPSMSGSGDRMAVCWAIFGKAPDLSLGLDPPKDNVLYHSCQGIDYNATGGNIGKNSCAEVTVFHTCRGSNGCHAQGGCGFVQLTTGGGNCSAAMSTATAKEMRTYGDPHRCTPPEGPNLAIGGCNPFAGPAYSPPGDNKCVTFGGCAVPISASQVFPKSGNMQLFKFVKVSGQVDGAGADRTEGHLRGGRERARRRLEGLLRGDGPRGHAAEAARADAAAAGLPALDVSGEGRAQARLGLPDLGDGVGLRDVHFAPPDGDAAGSTGGSAGSRSSARTSSAITATRRTCWSTWPRIGRW